MDIKLFISFMFVLQIFYWLVGKRASRNLRGSDDYFLAGKQIRFFPLMMTCFATQVGGGVVLGAAEEAYQFGWPVIFYPLGAALGLIVLGLGVGRKLTKYKVSTVAQIFEVVYRSPLLKKIASLLSVISLFMILVGQIIASNKFLVSLGVSNSFLFVAFWAIVILYTVRGGLKAVVSTDMVQAAFFSLVFLLAFGLIAFQGSSVALPHLDQVAQVSSKLSGWLLMPMLFMAIGQDMGQRCFAAASPKIVSQATVLAGISTIVIGIIPVFLGILAKNRGVVVPEGGSVLMSVIAQTTNPWITAIVGCAVLAAIISTATSLINAISSNVASDFSQKAWSLRAIKTVTFTLSIAAIFFAFYLNNIVDLLIQSYDLSVSCLFVPLFIILFKKQGHFLSALLSILLGATSFFVFKWTPIALPQEIASLLSSLLGYGCGELIAYRRSKLVSAK